MKLTYLTIVPLVRFLTFFFEVDHFLKFLAVLGLHCCVRFFSSCGEWGLLSSCGVQAFLAVEHGL